MLTQRDSTAHKDQDLQKNKLHLDFVSLIYNFLEPHLFIDRQKVRLFFIRKKCRLPNTLTNDYPHRHKPKPFGMNFLLLYQLFYFCRKLFWSVHKVPTRSITTEAPHWRGKRNTFRHTRTFFVYW